MNKTLLGIATILLRGYYHPKGDDLEQMFFNPPESTKPWCYWYWISDNISKEGIPKDQQARGNFKRLNLKLLVKVKQRMKR